MKKTYLAIFTCLMISSTINVAEAITPMVEMPMTMELFAAENENSIAISSENKSNNSASDEKKTDKDGNQEIDENVDNSQNITAKVNPVISDAKEKHKKDRIIEAEKYKNKAAREREIVKAEADKIEKEMAEMKAEEKSAEEDEAKALDLEKN